MPIIKCLSGHFASVLQNATRGNGPNDDEVQFDTRIGEPDFQAEEPTPTIYQMPCLSGSCKHTLFRRLHYRFASKQPGSVFQVRYFFEYRDAQKDHIWWEIKI
jgi:hypothetical protein